MRKSAVSRTFMLGLLPVFGPSSFGQAPAAPERQFNWEWRFSTWGAISHIREIRNIDRSYRLVPSANCCNQPSGSPAGYTLVLDPNIHPKHLAVMSVSFALGYSWQKNTLRAGPSWVVLGLYPCATIPSDPRGRNNTRENNEGGMTDRGTGRGLSYYASKARWSYIPGAIVEYSRQGNNGSSWFVGVHLQNYRLDFQRGYDTWNELTTVDHRPFARVSVFMPVVGFRTYKNLILFFGWSYPLLALDAQAVGARASRGVGGPVLGFSFGGVRKF